MKYTLNQLQIFLKISQTGSVTKAAQALHLTQPAVSIQLKNFQNQFDLPLTEVIGRKIYITDFGKEIAASASNIVEQVEAIDYKTLSYKRQLTGKLKISVVSTAKYVMPFFLADFVRKYPGMDLSMDVTNKGRVIESLEQNEVDFSLVSVLPSKMNIDHMEILPNKLFLIGKSATGKPPQNVFEEVPMIFRESGSATRQAMEKFINENQISVPKKLELTTNEAVKQAIIAGIGYSIMPLIGLKNELHSDQIRIIPTKGLPVQTSWSLIWLKNKKHTPVAEAYLKYLEAEREAIAEKHFDWIGQYD